MRLSPPEYLVSSPSPSLPTVPSPVFFCVDCLRGGMNHFLLERSMRKGEKGIALSLSLADCDRRHGRPKVQCSLVGIESGWRRSSSTLDILLGFVTSISSRVQSFSFIRIITFSKSGCAEKCPYRREGGKASFHIGRPSEGRESRSAEQICEGHNMDRGRSVDFSLSEVPSSEWR